MNRNEYVKGIIYHLFSRNTLTLMLFWFLGESLLLAKYGIAPLLYYSLCMSREKGSCVHGCEDGVWGTQIWERNPSNGQKAWGDGEQGCEAPLSWAGL